MADPETRSGSTSEEEKSLPVATSMTAPEIDETDKAPDGGLRAWLVAAGSACILFSTLGYSNSFGAFEEYYLSHQLRNESPDRVAWIGSVASFLLLGGGVVGGPLFDRFGSWMMRPAAIVYVFSLMMTSLCSRYWQFMLAQGVLMGLSMSLLQSPALAAVSQYFDRRRAAALGAVISGSSIGGVVMPIAISKMLNSSSLGFGWTVRIIGFVVAPLLAFACATVRPRLAPRPTTFFIGAAFQQPNYNLLIGAFFFMLMGMFTPLFYIPTYAVSRGMDPTLAAYLLAIVNAASTFGRILPGLLADRIGRVNVFGLGGIGSGIVILCLDQARTRAALIGYSVAIGFASGTIVSGGAAAFTLIPRDPRDIGTYMGMAMGIGSVAALISPPINGALAAHYGGFLQVSIFSGIACLGGGVIALLSKLATPEGLLGRT